MSQKSTPTWKYLALSGVIILGLGVVLWQTLAGNPDRVDQVRVQRGEFASDQPNPDAQMMIEHSRIR